MAPPKPRLRSLHLAAAAALCAALTVPSAASGTTMLRHFDLDGLVAAADVVLVARVEALRAHRWGMRDFIHTDATVVVEAVWRARGPARDLRKGARAVVRRIGGALDGVRQSVAGTSDLRIGDRVVLFARHQGRFLTLVGMGQGAWHTDGPGDAARVATGRPPRKAPAPDARLTVAGLRAQVEVAP